MVDNASNYAQCETNDKSVRRIRSQSSFTYEHFPVVCPTCEGKGEIDEDISGISGMVTFVPVKDERLRPAWTKVKIATLVCIVLSIGGTSAFFLYPREVTINVTAHQVQNFDFYRKHPWVVYQFKIHTNNKNFFSVKLKKVMMQVLYLQVLVGKKILSDTISIGIRTNKEVLISMNITYDGATAKYFKQQCFKDQFYVPQLMLSSAELSYWIHDEHIESKDDYFFTDCSSMVFPLPTKLLTTSTMHSTSTHPSSTPVTSSHNKEWNTVSTLKTIVTAKEISTELKRGLFPNNVSVMDLDHTDVIRYKKPIAVE